jgi:hypothetical protein
MTEQKHVIHFRCKCGASFNSAQEVERPTARTRGSHVLSVRHFFVGGTVLLRPGRDVEATCYLCAGGN